MKQTIVKANNLFTYETSFMQSKKKKNETSFLQNKTKKIKQVFHMQKSIRNTKATQKF